MIGMTVAMIRIPVRNTTTAVCLPTINNGNNNRTITVIGTIMVPILVESS